MSVFLAELDKLLGQIHLIPHTDELMELEDLRTSAIEFLDNGGGTGEDACNYCKGKRDSKSSDNPDKAIISLKNERETSYAT